MPARPGQRTMAIERQFVGQRRHRGRETISPKLFLKSRAVPSLALAAAANYSVSSDFGVVSFC